MENDENVEGNVLEDQTGRKRKLQTENWARNVTKRSRASGVEYVSAYTGKTVKDRPFVPLTDCCKTGQCYRKVPIDEQKRLYCEYWGLKDYNAQTAYLHGRMTLTSSQLLKGEKRNRSVLVEFQLSILGERILVCKTCFINVFNITRGRIDKLVEKIKLEKPLNDLRGLESTGTVLSEEVKDLILAHAESIPHQNGSHYSSNDRRLKYFVNSNLTLNGLYELFLDFYAGVSGQTDAPLSLSTYSKYFNLNIPFSFRLPRTDVCNVCFEAQAQGKLNDPAVQVHKRKYAKYKSLKEELTTNIPENTLVLEFDYGQNLPVPKLPVAEQFYLRLLWFYVFNVHVHGNDFRSYMFHFMEGICKKGANTVCSFLRYAITEEMKIRTVEKLILFSDAASGQNRNYTVFNFCATLASEYNIPVTHVFPVRGHSYCVCDRNFGRYTQKMKRMETIETGDEYANIIRLTDERFVMVDVSRNPEILGDYDEALKSVVKRPASLKISQNVIFRYTGATVTVSPTYSQVLEAKHQLQIKKSLRNLMLERPAVVGINKVKLQDVVKLKRYLSKNGAAFIDHCADLAATNETEADEDDSF